MGGSQSRTRKITVDNEDPTSVIKVSEDVVQRIRNSQDSSKAAPPTPPPVVHAAEPEPQKVPQQFLYEPVITSIQQRHANMNELKKNDEYWQNRMQNLKEHHCQMSVVMDEEYKKAMIDLYGVEKKAEKRKPPCEQTKERVLKCYKLHANEPMMCSQEVQAFQNCVDKTRIDLISSRS